MLLGEILLRINLINYLILANCVSFDRKYNCTFIDKIL